MRYQHKVYKNNGGGEFQARSEFLDEPSYVVDDGNFSMNYIFVYEDFRKVFPKGTPRKEWHKFREEFYVKLQREYKLSQV
jgi:hypothetical protein